MSKADLINLVYLAGGLLIVALGVPLMLGKVGPNGLYGFRTAKTKSSEAIWYPVNKALGRNLLIAGLVIAASAAGMFLCCRAGGSDLNGAVMIDLGVTVVALGAAIGQAVMVHNRM